MVVSNIIALVRSKLDMLSINDASFMTTDNDASNLDTMITNNILPAMRYVYKNCAEHKLNECTRSQMSFMGSTIKTGMYYGETNIPTLRLLSVTIPPSTTGMYTPARIVYYTEPTALLQDSINTMGVPTKPIAVITPQGSTNYKICIYTVNSYNQLMSIELRYVPIITITNGATNVWYDELQEAVIDYITALLLTTLGDARQQAFYELSISEMGLKIEKK